MKIQFYYADKNYIDYLKQAEISSRGFTCVPNVVYTNRDKFLYGSVLTINEKNYFVPVSSKYGKDKEHNLDIKTKDEINPIKGSLRFQYMIPIPQNCLKKLVIDEIADVNERTRISKELKFCRKNKDKIEAYALKTYQDVISQKDIKLSRNSCDFANLEKAFDKYVEKSKEEPQKGQKQSLKAMMSKAAQQKKDMAAATKSMEKWADDVQDIQQSRKNNIHR